MEDIIEKHSRIKKLVDEINLLTTAITSSKITFFEEVTVTVGYGSEDGCFKDLINWLYVLVIEVCGPNLNFFNEKFNVYKINFSSVNVLKDIHHIRTVSSHQLDLNNTDDQKKKNYYENWFYQLLRKSQAENDEDYNICINYLLDNILEYLEKLKLCILAAREDEHYDAIILPEWQRRIDRAYSVYDFERVFKKRLEGFGIDIFLDANKIAKREVEKWRAGLKHLQDGFDFEIEAGRIIDKYIAENKYCPVDPKDLIDIGADKSELKNLYIKVLNEFNRQAQSKEDLLQWIINEGLIS